MKKDTSHNHPSHSCGKECLACQGERLAVTSGSKMEAKQYEYSLDKKLRHREHRPAQGDAQEMSHTDHEAAMNSPQMAKEMEKDMRKRFWAALILTIPILLYSPLATNVFKITLSSPIPVNWLLLILTTPVVFWVGSIFIMGAYRSLRKRTLNMSVLVSTGVLAAYIFSVFSTLLGGEETFYEAATMLVTFVLFGHWMEMKSRRGTSDALRALFDLVPPKAIVIRSGKEITVPTSEIQLDDVVLVKPGDKIPVDGQIIEGETTIDESLVTGESLPVFKKVGERVIGGSINKTGSVKFKVTQVGSDTALAQIIKLVEKAQNSKAPGQRIADRFAGYLVVVAVAVGIATFLGWYLVAGWALVGALTFAISAVVIACPDALGLATPTAVAVGTGIGARYNILIKDAATLEQASKIQAIVLDKTGTLTEGRPSVNDAVPVKGVPLRDLLYFSGSAQKLSNHPLSEAIIREVKKRRIPLSKKVSDFEAVAGHGVRAKVDGRWVSVGTTRFMEQEKVDPLPIKDQVDRLLKEGKSVSLVSLDRKVIGVISASDEIKKTARSAIQGLEKLGIETAMITGDHREVAENVAGKIGVGRVFAEVLPEEKAGYVQKLQKEGKFVAMVGDGINDAPALAQADIGIAIGAGTDVAIEAANIVLMKSDPADILRAIELSKATVRKMKQNLFWAAIYNVLAIPVAAGVFYNSLGWFLRPEISALLMSVSSIIVATNAVLLKRIEPKLREI
ncbi:MAG: heavy metal translocating P-type ATPase [Patescibacteria group bacterium]|nr:MAG: heavy metal translocating P-type ATPase [Patescibacteria group bacterium]